MTTLTFIIAILTIVYLLAHMYTGMRAEEYEDEEKRIVDRMELYRKGG